MDGYTPPSFTNLPPITSSSPSAISPYTSLSDQSLHPLHPGEYRTPQLGYNQLRQHADPNLIIPRPHSQPHLAYWHQSSPSPYSPNLIQSNFPTTSTYHVPDGLLHGSPQSMYAPLPRRASEVAFATHPSAVGVDAGEDEELALKGKKSRGGSDDSVRKRKRASLPVNSVKEEGGSEGRGNSSGDIPGIGGAVRSATMGASAGTSSLSHQTTGLSEDEEQPMNGKAKGRSASGSLPNLTSCEACRKGKRRCEPSPLVPPTHPDAAKLPCARCRRFALECVRVKVQRRKGPPPVDLSAVSDALHGYAPGNNTTSRDNSLSEQQNRPPSRRTSSGHALHPDSSEGGSLPSSAFPLLAVSPSLSTGLSMPDNLDQVISGPVIDNIINLFFDYVYPLTPCLHRPTFIANLTARRDKTDPVFFALVLTVIASTLVQVPRSLVNLDKSEVESLVRRCVRVARSKVAYIFEEPGPVVSTYVVICYLEGIAHLFLGNNTAHVIATAQANQLALALRLNEETSYDGLDPIESEIRRRIYWLLFQADKSTACTRARTINLRLEDASALLLPTEVDDEQITANGILPQPFGRTSLIAGFNINTNLFRILNDALLLQRRRGSPTVDNILADLNNVNVLREKVMQTTLEVPDALQLRTAYDSRIASPALDWEHKLQERFLNYFQQPIETSHALNSFLVMQGNILVTQHLVRLVLLQTREHLLSQLSALTQMPLQQVMGMAGTESLEAAEDIACALLDGLNSLPVECVATNGPSLVQKVRFVAIRLMECSTEPSPSTERAQKLLMQFLSVLSVIEGMFTFGRDISAE